MMITQLIKKGYIFLTCCLLGTTALAQQAGRISGNVVDNHQPVEFATVTLAKLPDSTKVLYYVATDSLGKFDFEKLETGRYLLKISLIGYQPLVQAIQLNNANQEVILANLAFQSDNKTLNEVVVTAQKKLIQKTNEGFIVNAAANLTQAGGTATDLLKNTPTVSVDADGGITLRGKTPLILVNGRNSNLTNMDQLPASSIESIEIITNASAKYDANAESGIINIVLKKNKADGTNGALALGGGAGSRYRVNSSALLNHKSGKWNIGLNYDNRFAGRTRLIDGTRTNYNLPDSYFLKQNRSDERFEQLQNLKLAIDYQPNKVSSLSLEVIGNLRGQDNDETLYSNFYRQTNTFTTGNVRHSLELQREKVVEGALNYNRKFDNPKKLLSASLTSSLEKGRENTDIDTQALSEASTRINSLAWQRTHNYEDGVISNAKVDYTMPVGSHNLLDIGYKGIFRSIKTDYETADLVNAAYIINTAASNIFDFSEQVHAIYALLRSKNEHSPWNYELGVRAEQVDNNGHTQDQTTQFTNSYLKIFPTANLIYTLNAETFWKLSYGKRINRPGLGQLNPFTDITDALNPHSGNPYLKPEIIHAFELGFNKEHGEFSFSTNLFYRYAQNTIRNFFQEIGNGVVLNKPMNIGSSNSVGLENVVVGKISSFYDFNASVSLFQLQLNGSNILSDAVQSSFNWFGKLINNFVVGKSGKLQLIGNYTSAATTPQGQLIPLYFADLGYQQKLGKGNARLGLTIVDLFNTLKSGSKNYTTEFGSVRNSKADTRAIMLTFAYSFRTTVKDKMLENKFSREW
ncbi:MAG: TonB-dependent receptor [Spirosomataceae bacterium]